MRDHPRACGEQAYQRPYFVPVVGSSPRMRGAVGEVYLTALSGRIIPAHAGSSRA